MKNIVERIIKCLGMAESQTYNENEAANALRIAKRLAAKHGLDIAALESQRQGKEKENVKYAMTKQAVKPKRGYLKYEKILFCVCDELFGTKHYQHLVNNSNNGYRQATMIFIGTPVDVRLSVTVFLLLKKMVERNARQLYGYKWSRTHRSYCEGFTSTLYERAEEEVPMDTYEEATSLSLVVVNKKEQVEGFFKELELDKGRCKKQARVDINAFVRGGYDATEVDLNFKESLQ